MTTPYLSRIKRVKKILAEEGRPSALLLSSAAPQTRSRDQQYPFRQHSDFYYLTGSNRAETVLIISSDAANPVIIGQEDSEQRLLWEGRSEKLADIAERCEADLITTDDIAGSVRGELRGKELLFYQNAPGTIAWQTARELFEMPSWERNGFPFRFAHSDAILEKLRVFKDKHEIASIEEAIGITYSAIRAALPLIGPGAVEREIAAALDYGFHVLGAQPAFASIVAAGRSAAILHYNSLDRSLGKNELLLIDCGAEYQMYAADITRAYPARGRFSGAAADVYSIVLAAQKAALSKIKHGARVDTVHKAAATVMTEGLVELGVLRGKISALVKKEAYRPYFPHSIGHMLGLDVHDIGKMRGAEGAVLKEGMVITIEPGLYFPRRAGKVPPCGVRIEDDVLVTKEGCKILSAGIPKEMEEVEALMAF